VASAEATASRNNVREMKVYSSSHKGNSGEDRLKMKETSESRENKVVRGLMKRNRREVQGWRVEGEYV
jgi:hypothetical protein